MAYVGTCLGGPVDGQVLGAGEPVFKTAPMMAQAPLFAGDAVVGGVPAFTYRHVTCKWGSVQRGFWIPEEVVGNYDAYVLTILTDFYQGSPR